MQIDGRRGAVPMGMEPGGPSPDASQHVLVLSLRDLLQIIWRRLWIIVLAAIICGAVAVGYSLMQTPQYEASIRILVGQDQGIVGGNIGNAVSLQQITKTVAEAIKSDSMAEDVIQDLGLQMSPATLLANLNVQQIPQTQFVQVSYRDPDPERAQEIANAIGDAFSKQISEMSPSTSQSAAPSGVPGANLTAGTLTATVWERAKVPEAPVSPRPWRTGFAALVLGGLLGVGLAFLLEYLDDRWRSPEEVEQISGVPTYGVIPEFRVGPGAKKKGEY